MKIGEVLEWFALKMHKVGTVTLNNGGGSQGRQTTTELYYSGVTKYRRRRAHDRGDREAGCIRPGNGVSSWQREFIIMSMKWAQTLESDTLGWSPDSLVTSDGICSLSQGFPLRVSMKTQVDDV